VVFCDLVASTELSQRLDAEELREVVRAYQEKASEVVARFKGYVAQYLGDGILVYFGYPQAHEDDAERAVRAGLGIVEGVAQLNPQLVEKHGIGLALRIGIHTGRVIVGEMGGGERREMLALGDTANIAARLPGEAEPDTLVGRAWKSGSTSTRWYARAGSPAASAWRGRRVSRRWSAVTRSSCSSTTAGRRFGKVGARRCSSPARRGSASRG
jgi:class 3 adenylate cyclase